MSSVFSSLFPQVPDALSNLTPLSTTQKWKDPFAVRARTRLARVVDVASLPPPIPGVPEMAIIGRSNVGKSTLLNSVLNIRGARKAAVADRPGVTQSLDFYMLGPRDR